MSALRTEWRGASPWDEVWFIEAHLPDGRAIWLRYTLHAGLRREAQVWSLLFDGGTPVASAVTVPLDSVRHHGTTLFGCERGRLEIDQAQLPDKVGRPMRLGTASGTTDTASWQLTLTAAGPTHEMVPPAVRSVGRTYTSAVSDLRLDGVITTPTGAWRLDGARGVLGHVRGRRNRTAGWVWCHAQWRDASFEALSAVIGLGVLRTPPLTTVQLEVGGERWTFSEPADLLFTSSQVVGDAWSFQTHAPGARLSGRMTLGPLHSAARVRYHDERNQPLWCTNHPYSRLELNLQREGQPPLRLWTDACSGEIVTRAPPILPPLVG